MKCPHRDDTFCRSVGGYGSRSLQRSMRRVPIVPPERIRTLPFGAGLVLLRSAPPIVTDLGPWTCRQSARQQGSVPEDGVRPANSTPQVLRHPAGGKHDGLGVRDDVRAWRESLVMGQLSAGSSVKAFSAGLAGVSFASSMAAHKSVLAGFARQITAVDVATLVANTSMLGRLEALSADMGVSVVNRLISSSGVQVSLTSTIYEAVTSILRDDAAAQGPDNGANEGGLWAG